MAHEDSISLWLINKHPLWLNEEINESGGESDASSSSYIPQPFPKHDFKPHGWHDILATFGMCANFHATKHCDDEAYDLEFMNIVNFVLIEEVEKIILEVKGTPRLD